MIVFQSVSWRNFLSTGNVPTTIKLNEHYNTLIVGENGSGKSTILDAITFALFGKPFRKINKPTLINSINDSDCLVELYFQIGSKEYKIERGLKPAIFNIYIDGSRLDIPASNKDFQTQFETQILKLNYKTFTQVVVLGSSTFVPFMQLTAAARREIIEDLLDIQIFTTMNNKLKDKVSQHKLDTKDVALQLESNKNLISIQKQTLNKIKESNSIEADKIKNNIDYYNIELTILDESKHTLASNLTRLGLQSVYEDMNKNIQNEKDASKIMLKLESKIKSIEDSITFFQNNSNCPTCEQSLNSKFIENSIDSKLKSLAECTTGKTLLEKKIKDFQILIRLGKENEEQMLKIKNEIIQIENEILANIKIISNLNNQLESVVDNQDTTHINDSILTLENELKNLEIKKEELATEAEIHKVVSSLLKDSGIKTLIIKQYLPVINQLVNKYLSQMDFFVNFTLDENFNETIKSRHRDIFSYENFSEGEKKRIDLSLLFTWREIAKMKNSINTNLLILDEIFDSSLDDSGTQEFLKILYSLDKSQNVFVISHKSDILLDKFKNNIKFEKIKGFSKIV